MKKILSLMCILLMIVLPVAGCFGAENSTSVSNSARVFDDAGLFSEKEAAELEERIAELQSRYDMDFAILTNKAQHSGSAGDFADDFYDQHDLGFGSDKRGMILLYDLYLGEIYLSTSGDAIDYITNSRLKDFEEKFGPVIRKAKKGEITHLSAFKKALDLLAGYVKDGIPAGQYRYDEKNGRVLKRYGFTPLKIVISALVSIATGLIISLSTISGYRLKGKTYFYDYKQNVDVHLVRSEDRFINTTHTRVRIPRASEGGGGHGGGGSGVHSSSGGSSHGGGGFRV